MKFSNEELILKLKSNRYAFGMWPEPECYGKKLGEAMQAKAEDIGPWDFEKFASRWVTSWDKKGFLTGDVYRLRPDYEAPEAEVGVIECKIGPGASEAYSGLLVYVNLARNSLETLLCRAINDPDFIGFRWEGILWGCLYKHKETGVVVDRILASMLNEYDVINMTEAVACFRSNP